MTTTGVELGVGNYLGVMNFSIDYSSYIYTRKVFTLAKVAGLLGGKLWL